MPGAREKKARATTQQAVAETAAALNGTHVAEPEKKPWVYRPARGSVPFVPGQSGNPGGKRPSVVDGVHIPTLAREYCAEAIRAVVEIMRKPEAMDTDRIRAANTILDRGLGKAPSVVAHLTNRDAAEYSDDELLAIILGKPDGNTEADEE